MARIIPPEEIAEQIVRAKAAEEDRILGIEIDKKYEEYIDNLSPEEAAAWEQEHTYQEPEKENSLAAAIGGSVFMLIFGLLWVAAAILGAYLFILSWIYLWPLFLGIIILIYGYGGYSAWKDRNYPTG